MMNKRINRSDHLDRYACLPTRLAYISLYARPVTQLYGRRSRALATEASNSDPRSTGARLSMDPIAPHEQILRRRCVRALPAKRNLTCILPSRWNELAPSHSNDQWNDITRSSPKGRCLFVLLLMFGAMLDWRALSTHHDHNLPGRSLSAVIDRDLRVRTWTKHVSGDGRVQPSRPASSFLFVLT